MSSNSSYSAIGGGVYNRIGTNSARATIAGGGLNQIGDNADHALVLGGSDNEVGDGASYALAAGRRAHANHEGAFVWADDTDADFESTATNQFSVRAGGGARFETGGAGMTVDGLAVLTGTDGTTLTNLNASQLTQGTVPDAQLSGIYSSALILNNASNVLAGDGSALTQLDASALTQGTVPDAQLSGTYSLSLIHI